MQSNKIRTYIARLEQEIKHKLRQNSDSFKFTLISFEPEIKVQECNTTFNYRFIEMYYYPLKLVKE